MFLKDSLVWKLVRLNGVGTCTPPLWHGPVPVLWCCVKRGRRCVEGHGYRWCSRAITTMLWSLCWLTVTQRCKGSWLSPFPPLLPVVAAICAENSRTDFWWIPLISTSDHGFWSESNPPGLWNIHRCWSTCGLSTPSYRTLPGFPGPFPGTGRFWGGWHSCDSITGPGVHDTHQAPGWRAKNSDSHSEWGT